MYMYFKKGKKKETFQTFVGSGHSSSNSVITAGPRGSSRGIDTTKDSTTCSQLLISLRIMGGRVTELDFTI